MRVRPIDARTLSDFFANLVDIPYTLPLILALEDLSG